MRAEDDIPVYWAKGWQTGADNGDGGFDKRPYAGVDVYPAAVCERDAADGDDADDADYADAEEKGV